MTSAAVLRNIGVPVTVQKLSEGGDQLFDPDGAPKTEEKHVRFTINVLAQLETLYNGRQTYAPDGGKLTAIGATAWQDLLRAEPISTTRNVLALIWNMKTEDVGNILIPQRMGDYAGALISAYAIAEGVDPLVATTAVQAQVDAAVAAGQSRFQTANGVSPTLPS